MALTKKDLEKLEKYFATKEDIKSEINQLRTDIREDFSNLQSSVDTYAGKADGYFQEMLMLSKKVDRQEQWIKKIAKEVGVELEY